MFALIALSTLLPVVTAPMGLAAGLVFALVIGSPLGDRTSRWASQLMKVCIVGLGFGISFAAVLNAGTTGLLITGIAAASVVATGVLLGALMGVDRTAARLISSGTAICGGSAIAALSPVLKARAESIAVALAIVFILNAVALYLFPLLGQALELNQEQFAIWSAIAIHDTASVVGAASTFGDDALQLATVLKLARALWIIPLVLVFAWWVRRKSAAASSSDLADAPMQWPWFILVFVLASASRSLLPSMEALFDGLALAARQLLVLTLFLVGAGLSVAALKTVGMKPLMHGLLLWLLTGGLTLLFVLGIDRPWLLG
ncbi:MAG: putative sulfate exporter family transporter [Pseudomonadota bacterium]